MKTLSVNQVLQLHVLAIRQFGGSDGLRDLVRLESIVDTQKQEAFGVELYKSVFDKAAALIRGLIGGHPFIDGNKRTGMLAGVTLLEVNGYTFVAQKGELEDFAVQVVVDHLDVPAIASWLEAHSAKK
jgi:death-on-curing protein